MKRTDFIPGLLIVFATIGTIIIGYIILKDYVVRMKQQNKYMCAVYGYYEDCKTPLREEDKLK